VNTALPGIDGANPLGFLAAMGLLRLLSAKAGRIRFAHDGTNRAIVEGDVDGQGIADLVASDASASAKRPSLAIEYEKKEKNKIKRVRDLKSPPGVFEQLLVAAKKCWIGGEDREFVSDLAAFATSLEVDGKGNTKPTAFHFTAANQEFLKAADESRRKVTADEVRESLFAEHGRKPGKNLRWDPRDARSHALMAEDPDAEGTSVDATLEWLAFRGMVAFPVVSVGRKLPATTGVTGRGEDMEFTWPLWRVAAEWATARSLVRLPVVAMTRERGVFSIATSGIRRTAQGFGNFGPAEVRAV
jgi:hypothetical protein